MPTHLTLERLKALVEADGCIFVRTEPVIQPAGEEKVRNGPPGRPRKIWYTCACQKDNPDAPIKKADWSNFKAGKRCGDKNCMKQKAEATSMAKYGTKTPMLNPKIAAKAKASLIKNYGVDTPLKSPEIRAKSEATFMTNWGASHAMKTEEGKQRLVDSVEAKHGAKWYFQTDVFKAKSKETSQKLYNTDFPNQSEDVKEKIRTTNIQNLGVPYPLQNPDIKAEMARFIMEKYGVDNPMKVPEIRAKADATNIERYGAANPFMSPICQETSRQTCIERYGVPYAMQNLDILHKQQMSSYAIKQVELGGKTFTCQGYEPVALEHLVTVMKYHPASIETSHEYSKRSRIPTFWYARDDGSIHRYVPDIYIHSEKMFIEVKSDYTAEQDQSLDAKLASIVDAGYRCQLWVITDKGKITKYNVDYE